MKKYYEKFEMECILFAEDAIRTSGNGTDEGMGAGKDYFADDDFIIPTSV